MAGDDEQKQPSVWNQAWNGICLVGGETVSVVKTIPTATVLTKGSAAFAGGVGIAALANMSQGELKKWGVEIGERGIDYVGQHLLGVSEDVLIARRERDRLDDRIVPKFGSKAKRARSAGDIAIAGEADRVFREKLSEDMKSTGMTVCVIGAFSFFTARIFRTAVQNVGEKHKWNYPKFLGHTTGLMVGGLTGWFCGYLASLLMPDRLEGNPQRVAAVIGLISAVVASICPDSKESKVESNAVAVPPDSVVPATGAPAPAA